MVAGNKTEGYIQSTDTYSIIANGMKHGVQVAAICVRFGISSRAEIDFHPPQLERSW